MQIKKDVAFNGLLLTSAVLAGCGGVSDNLASPWSYEKNVNAATKNIVHTSTVAMTPEGSSSGKSEVQITLQCEKEGDPATLMLEVTTFDGEDTSENSALELGGKITIRLNNTIIGPLKREGTEFSNSTKWDVQSLNLVPLYEAAKGEQTISLNLTQQLANLLRIQNPAYAKYVNTIWNSELVFLASTSVGEITAVVSLDDPNVKKTVEGCGFTYGLPPPKAGKTAAASERAAVDNVVEAVIPDEASPAEAAPSEPVGAEPAAPAEAAEPQDEDYR